MIANNGAKNRVFNISASKLKDTPVTNIYFPNLDGLRFLCFLAVFLHHSFATNFTDVLTNPLYVFIKNDVVKNGNLGVNFFFVLSGFLITYLLLAEKAKHQTINLKAFYVRRILRIWPLFYFCVAFGFFIFPQIKLILGETPNENASLIYYLTFLNNIEFVYQGVPDSSVLSILWSVAIEEQFYLVWPVLILLIPGKYYQHFFTLIIIGSFLFRYYHSNNESILLYHSFSCISDMTLGGVLARLAFHNKEFMAKITNASKAIWIFLYALIIVAYFFKNQIFINDFLKASERLIISFLFGMVILEQNFAKNSIFKMSKFKIISKLGTYTYGLYCLHMIGILIVVKTLNMLGLNKNLFQIFFIEGILSLIVTILLAWISFHYFEKPFLTLKKRFVVK